VPGDGDRGAILRRAHPEMKAPLSDSGAAQDSYTSLPGTFRNRRARRLPERELAATRMETLVHLLVKWIVDVYHKLRSGLSGTRLRSGAGLNLNEHRLPANSLRSTSSPPHGASDDVPCGSSPISCSAITRAARDAADLFGKIVERGYREEDVGSVSCATRAMTSSLRSPGRTRYAFAGLNRGCSPADRGAGAPTLRR